MTGFLEVEDLLVAAEAFLGGPPAIRDAGLLDSAAHRPSAAWLGEDVYPDLDTKAAALLLSLAGNRPLVDGNKRLGWVSTRLFYVLNGADLRASHDEAYELVVAVAEGRLDDVAVVAPVLRRWRTDAHHTT